MVGSSPYKESFDTPKEDVDIEQKQRLAQNAVVKLYPVGVRFINGIAREYEDDFPIQLEGIVDRGDFEEAINQINNTLNDYWPCYFCVGWGYVCCLCTAGISLCAPAMCIQDAESYTRTLIERINYRPCFRKRGVTWKLVKKLGSSWIEISCPVTTGNSMAIDDLAAIKPQITETRVSELPYQNQQNSSTSQSDSSVVGGPKSYGGLSRD